MIKTSTLVWLLLATLIGCSEGSKKNSQKTIISEENREYEAVATGLTPSGVLEQDIVNINYGSLLNNQTKLYSLTIKNNSTSGEILNSVVRNNVPENYFLQISGNCSNVKPKSSCTIRISFDGRRSPGIYEGDFSLNFSDESSQAVKVSVEVTEPAPPVADDLIQNVVVSPSSLPFGDFTANQTKTLSLSVKNNNSKSVVFPVQISGPYSITSDGCHNRTLGPKSSCTIRISFNSNGKPTGSNSGSISYGSLASSLSANVLSSIEIQQIVQAQAQLNSNIVMFYGGVQYTKDDTLALGDKTQGQIESLNFNLRNIGSAPATISSSSFASNIAILSNSCNTTLAPNGSCLIRASHNPQSQSSLDLSINLGFETRVFPISMNFLSSGGLVACSLSNAALNGISDMNGVSSVSGNLPNCSVSSCLSNYSISNN